MKSFCIIGLGKFGQSLALSLAADGKQVMVIDTDNGKINLSVKRLEAKPQRENAAPRNNFRKEGAPNPNRPARTAPTPPPEPKTADQLFEERLKQFMTESDSKISSIRQYSDHRTKSRRR